MDLSEKLRTIRKERRLGQVELAEMAGLTQNKIQRYEQSGQKPKGEDTIALAKVLGVTCDYLLDDTLPYPPPEEHLSEKVAMIRRLEGLIGALSSRAGEPAAVDGQLPDVLHLPVFKLGAGFDVVFDAAGQPTGERARDMYVDDLGEGTFIAAELHGSSMRGSGDEGFSIGEIVVFKEVPVDEIASGDFVYVRTGEHGLFRQAFIHGDRLRLRALNPADPEILLDKSETAQICRLVRRVKDY